MRRSATRAGLMERMRSLLDDPMPLPGGGETAVRHRRLMAIGREDLSLARLAEAHWDAVAILAEVGRQPARGALYGVWAAEMPSRAMELRPSGEALTLNGTKMFCSGAGLVDRALVTAGLPGPRLVDVDVRCEQVQFDTSSWHTAAFQFTNTATATFRGARVSSDDLLGEEARGEDDWYSSRPGFWHGACGPAACWAGGAISLADWAAEQRRDDAHTMAHVGAMQASAWGLEAVLETAGREIDASPGEGEDAAKVRALRVRHLVEQAATDILRRLTRAFGPYPLAFDEAVSLQYQELDLYLRQSHAERDLEKLGRTGKRAAAAAQ